MSHIGYRYRQHREDAPVEESKVWAKRDTHNAGYFVSKEHSSALARAIFKTMPIREISKIRNRGWVMEQEQLEQVNDKISRIFKEVLVALDISGNAKIIDEDPDSQYLVFHMEIVIFRKATGKEENSGWRLTVQRSSRFWEETDMFISDWMRGLITRHIERLNK
jgi:hypothetical protein